MTMRVFSRFSYQKLRQDDENDPIHKKPIKSRSWFTRIRIRPGRLRRLRIAGFRKFFKMRRVRVGRLSWSKVVRRFKESQAHFGDLFSGNYLFMQLSPASLNNNKKPYLNRLNYVVDDQKQQQLSDVVSLSRSSNKTMFTGRVACPTLPIP